MAVLNAGGLVAFPTDTVYGLGALVHLEAAIERLYVAKDRDLGKAIPVLVGDAAQLSAVTSGLSANAKRLAERFWPGPLTLVIAKRPDLPAALSFTPTVGVRMPDHPAALALLRRSGPLAVTSDNLSGRENPQSAEDVLAQLDGRVELVLDGGATPGGVPSTVLDCTGDQPVVLRQGPLTWEILQAALPAES
jgi:L-threonylcarbamoyladenylate synthase